MFISHLDPDTPGFAAEKRPKKLLILGGAVLLGIVLIGGIAYTVLRSRRVETPPQPAPRAVAELVSAQGVVLVQSSGRSEWREVQIGAQFMEGDQVRTDSAGAADIRYANGSMLSIPEATVFTVRSSGENRIEISAPPLSLDNESESGTAVNTGAASGPTLELQQIIPFGRSLELIGKVEPGSSLKINSENVEVGGDGSFKHFTRPFPESARSVQLTLRVKNLAGRVRVWKTTHSFLSHGDN